MAVSFTGAHVPRRSILMRVRWSAAYLLTYRHVEEPMPERGVSVDHTTVKRWVVQQSPLLEAAFHRRKRPIWLSWSLDETSMQLKGAWQYLDRAVEKHGHVSDVRLTEPRDDPAATRVFTKAVRRQGVPETLTIDGREAHAAPIRRDHAEDGTAIVIRQGQDHPHMREHAHRTVTRLTRPLLGFKSLRAAPCTRASVERMPMLKKGQGVAEEGAEGWTPPAQVYALAASSPHGCAQLTAHRRRTEHGDRSGSGRWPSPASSGPRRPWRAACCASPPDAGMAH